ncbi:MAG: hypothetical protein KC535_03040 [Nanoarchaeota archaeon]|nr:hypothetical protein [Nanoarchaeota archaeon]
MGGQIEYQAIARRLMNYKKSKGERAPWTSVDNEVADACASCGVWYRDGGDETAWLNDLTRYVWMRHSWIPFIKRLSYEHKVVAKKDPVLDDYLL